MKTSKHFIFALICITLSMPSWAYDFTAVNGVNTFFFNITSNTAPYTVEVTSENQAEPYYTDTSTSPRGFLDIPSTVNYNSITYSVTAIGDNAFRYCEGITSLAIPNTITTIGMYAFEECLGLTSVFIPNSVVKIKEGAFLSLWGVTTLTLPNNIDSISYLAFAGISAGILTIPNSVKYIGVSAFAGLSSASYIIIPNSVNYIDSYAFGGCASLTSVTLGTSVKYIADKAFSYNYSLIQFTCKSSIPPVIDSTTFLYTTNVLNTIIVPCQTKTVYEAADYWKKFSKIREKFLSTVTTKSNNTAWGTVSSTIPDCLDLSSTLTASAKPGYVFVQWTDGNNENPRTVVVTQDTTFIADFELDNAIGEIDKNENLLIYPNPTTNQFSIDFGQQSIQAVLIYDVVGKEIAHLIINDSTATINAQTWQNGIYFVRIITDNRIITKRIIKE